MLLCCCVVVPAAAAAAVAAAELVSNLYAPLPGPQLEDLTSILTDWTGGLGLGRQGKKEMFETDLRGATRQHSLIFRLQPDAVRMMLASGLGVSEEEASRMLTLGDWKEAVLRVPSESPPPPYPLRGQSGFGWATDASDILEVRYRSTRAHTACTNAAAGRHSFAFPHSPVQGKTSAEIRRTVYQHGNAFQHQGVQDPCRSDPAVRCGLEHLQAWGEETPMKIFEM